MANINDNLEIKEVAFSPKLEGLFRTRFYEKAQLLHDINSTDTISKEEVQWVENECTTNLKQRKIYRAVWFLLRDLVKAHWVPRFRDGRLILTMPNLMELLSKHSDSIQASSIHSPESKAFLRSWMDNSRVSRLQASSDFIRIMENPGGNKHSILDLIADGHELAERLKKAKEGSCSVSEAVRPYLQLVNEGERDKFTNLKLSEIWRYFRLTWSTPALTTPGRTMLYLIRDAAHPMHAVMGIASLENCALQINDRDNFIGWTVPALKEKLQSGNYAANVLFQQLRNYLEDGINSIQWDELCTKQEIKNPSLKVVQRLNEEVNKANLERKDALLSDEDNEQSELGQISLAAEKALYRRKRAEQLARFLDAKIVFEQFHPRALEDYLRFCDEEKSAVAIRTAFAAQKAKHIGSSMLELNVCGAVKPYNEILAGKLVALAALSPKVAHDYKERYGKKASDIATRLKGEEVFRPADLAFIGTTSLYFVGSSQYNRLRIPAEVFDGNYDVQWKELGTTSGYGTIQISDNTSKSLSEVRDYIAGYTHINHIFGEGASPKLRLLSQSLSDILDSTSDETQQFMQHAMKRIVYGAALAKNTSEYLMGYDSSLHYYTDFDKYEEGTQKIMDFWVNRWLASRINYEPVYSRLEEFKPESVLVSNYLEQTESYIWKEMTDTVLESFSDKDNSSLDFIRGFYRGKSAFADSISKKKLDSIHIPSPLERAVTDSIKEGDDVVLTGNAGDGKTHLIKILQEKLSKSESNVIFELDASTLSYEELFANWSNARKEGKPYVIAINAAVLFGLYKYAKDKGFRPVEVAFNLMCNSVIYRDIEAEKEERVSVFDLSKRNVLTKDNLKSVISKLTNSAHYQKCEQCPLKASCDVHYARQLLNSDLFQHRLSYVFNRVTMLGYHATLRELQSFISFLIFGDRSCEVLSKTSGENKYSLIELIYGEKSGKGPLFDIVKQAFDPVRVSHPTWDERILQGDYEDDSWAKEISIPNDSIDSTDVITFSTRKRQFYFFNLDGESLIGILDDNLAKFQGLLDEDEKTQKKELIKKLNYFFIGSCENPSELNVWVGHRFDNGGRKVLLSNSSLRIKDLEILKPQIHPLMKDGISYYPNYLLLCKRGHEDVSLKIDFNLFELLQGTEKGIPVMFVETNRVKKVWRFMDQLQSSETQDPGYIRFTIVDIQQKKKISVAIDIESKQYTLITSSPIV